MTRGSKVTVGIPNHTPNPSSGQAKLFKSKEFARSINWPGLSSKCAPKPVSTPKSICSFAPAEERRGSISRLRPGAGPDRAVVAVARGIEIS